MCIPLMLDKLLALQISKPRSYRLNAYPHLWNELPSHAKSTSKNLYPSNKVYTILHMKKWYVNTSEYTTNRGEESR